MPELLPETPQTESVTSEISREQILDASAEDIITASNAQAARLQDRLTKVPQGGVEWSYIRKELVQVGQTSAIARQYRLATHLSHENFGEYLEKEMENDDDLDRFEQLQTAEEWFKNQVSGEGGGLIGEAMRQRQEVQPQASQPQENALPETGTTTEEWARQKQQAIENSRGSIEQAFGLELLDDIARLSKNHTQLHTDVNDGFKDIGDGSRQWTKQAHLPEDFREVFKREHKAADWREELNEVAMFSDVIEQDTREVTHQQEEKGRFGRKHVSEYTTTEAIPDSDHPKMIRNETTGQDEPTVRFRYSFNMRSAHANRAASNGELPKYQEFGGHRSGQLIDASIDLPKSIADSLQEKVRQNPRAARQLAEKLFLNNNDGAITEQAWRQGKSGVDHPIRPPYEQLPEDWNMAIVTSQETEHYGRPSTLSYNVDRVQTGRS